MNVLPESSEPYVPAPLTTPSTGMSGWQKFWAVIGVLFVIGLIAPDDDSSDSYTTDYSDTTDTTDSEYVKSPYTVEDNPARQRCLDELANVESWDDLDATIASSDCGQ